MSAFAPRLQKSFTSGFTFALVVGTLCAGTAGLAFGYSSGSSFQIFLTIEWSSFFASCLNIGGMFGSLISGFFMTKYGRQWTMVIACVPGVLGWIGLRLSAEAVYDRYAPTVLFMFSRILTGVSAGLAIPASSSYVIEIAPEPLHNLCGTLPQIGIVTGITMAYVFGASLVWEVIAVWNAFILITVLLMTFIIPESPKWLAKMQQYEKADTANAWLFNFNNPCVESGSEKAAEASSEHETNNTTKLQLMQYLIPHTAIPSNQRRHLRVACFIMLLQQFTGINAICYFAESICMFGSLLNSSYCAVFIGVAQLLFTIIGAYFIHRFPRKRMLHVSAIIMCVSHFAHGMILLLNSTYWVLTFLSQLCIIAFILGFSLGWGPLAIVVVNNLFPTATRGFGVSTAMAVNWICSFLVTASFEPLTLILGPVAVFWTFSAFCLFCSLFVRRYLPDVEVVSGPLPT